mmetsp:Transcript_34298/g.71412  ORF Transcript_34298/g.71412 Transcript_34298/m.71412 type:complete len:254 (-) Transcript_34298:464-1225(-)
MRICRVSSSLLCAFACSLALLKTEQATAFQSTRSRVATKPVVSSIASVRGGGKQDADQPLGLVQKVKTVVRKCAGVHAKPPAASSWSESFHTFAGVLVNLLVLTYMNTKLIESHGKGASIVLGPFGALATLCYILPGAPPSQPKNAILGQSLSVTLAILLKKIPLSTFWTMEARVSFTTALAIGLMAKFGWTHPPAGAATLLFASNPALGWSHLGVLLLANVVTLVLSSIINNLSPTRQYPIFWGLGRSKKEP